MQNEDMYNTVYITSKKTLELCRLNLEKNLWNYIGCNEQVDNVIDLKIRKC